MNSERPIQKLKLDDLLDPQHRRIKLPYKAIREVKQAAQTLGGLDRMTSAKKRQTFASHNIIAIYANLPLRTVENHLRTLEESGWIYDHGRHQRRTCTIELTDKAIKEFTKDGDGYGIVPFHLLTDNPYPSPTYQSSKPRPLLWKEVVIVSVMLATLMKIRKKWLEKGDKMPFGFWDAVKNQFGDVDRFRFSERKLEEITGLTRTSIRGAKRMLLRRGIIERPNSIEWIVKDDNKNVPDAIKPSPYFYVHAQPICEHALIVNNRFEQWRVAFKEEWYVEFHDKYDCIVNGK